MTTASILISCAAIGMSGYQLYWLRRWQAAAHELQRLRRTR